MPVKTCRTCQTEKPFSDFHRRAKSRDGLSDKCKACHSVYCLAWEKRNPEKVSEQRKRHYARHKERHKALCSSRARSLRQMVFQLLGEKCIRCGFADPRALQIDHINGGGRNDRAKNAGPWTFHATVLRLLKSGEGFQVYQLLCANCNQIKKVEQGEQPWSLKRKLAKVA